MKVLWSLRLRSPRYSGGCLGLGTQSPVSLPLACSIRLCFSFNVDLWFWSCWLTGSIVISCRYFIYLYCFSALMPKSVAYTGCHLMARITSLYIDMCVWYSPDKACFYFPLVRILSRFFFSCLQHILILFISIAFLLLHLSSLFSFAFFPLKLWASEMQQQVYAAADMYRFILFLSHCRLLLLQVMPLSHLHPSHFLLVQTCLVLYLSALLPYPQVRNLPKIWVWFKFGHQFSALTRISIFRALILSTGSGEDFEDSAAGQGIMIL